MQISIKTSTYREFATAGNEIEGLVTFFFLPGRPHRILILIVITFGIALNL